jgi:hypothetical protein
MANPLTKVIHRRLVAKYHESGESTPRTFIFETDDVAKWTEIQEAQVLRLMPTLISGGFVRRESPGSTIMHLTDSGVAKIDHER